MFEEHTQTAPGRNRNAVTGLRKFGPNTEGRDFVVGDIHGEVNHLLEFLDDHVGFNYKKDRLFCVGDLIDRGPQSPAAITLLTKDWFFSVVGNHEHMLLTKDFAVWWNNGGSWWLDEVHSHQEALEGLIRAHCSLAFEIEHSSGKKIGIVHGETPGPNWEEINWHNHYNVEAALWGRSKIRLALRQELYPVENIDYVFHGHTVTTQGPIQSHNQIWIDTGAVFRSNKEAGHLGYTVVNLDRFLQDGSGVHSPAPLKDVTESTEAVVQALT